MIQPRDVDNVPNEQWDSFKKSAQADELWYNGPGDLLDTPEGRSKFCKLNKTSVFKKTDPEYPGYSIWVFNNQGVGMVVKKRSRVDPVLMENIEYDAEGVQMSKSFEPA